MEFKLYVDIYLKVGVQRFVDMGGGFIFYPVSKTFEDLEKAKEFAKLHNGIFEVQDLGNGKFGINKVEVRYIEYPEPIIVNDCGKKEEELITEESTYLGIKFVEKYCCKDHHFPALVPEEIRDFWEMKYEEAKSVKH